MKRKWTVLVIVLCSLFVSSAFAQTYAPAANYATQLQPVGIAYGDFNEDGKTDVVVTNAGSSTLSLFLGNGNGTLGTPISIAVGPNPLSVVAADFNGDGHQDLAVSLGNSQTIQILFGAGNSTFLAPVSIAIPGTVHFTIGQLMVADFNLDRKPDLGIATDFGVAVFVNNGNGAFSEATVVDPNASIADFDVKDVNGDGKPDLVGVESGADVNGDAVGNVFLALGNGDGTFQAITPITQFTGTPAGIAVGDLNNDGLPDIVVSNSGGVIGGGGGPGGPICTPRICLPVDGGTGSPTINVPGAILMLLQQPKGVFSQAASLTNDRSPGAVILADLNGDHNLDIAEASSATPELLLFSNQGNAAFSPPTALPLPFVAASVLSASLSNTSALDLAATLPGGNEISVFVNQGANTLSLTSSLNPSNVGQAVTLTATVHPVFPNAISGSVIFADGANSLGSSPVDASGVSTLATSFNSAGAHSLLAVYSGNSTLVGGSSARISQQVKTASASVALTSSGNPTVFGQGVSFTITVTGTGSGAAPTGSVNLLDGPSIISVGMVDGSGKLVVSTSSLSIGTHTLTAQYSGDSTYGPATSPAITQAVNKSNAAVNLSSSVSASVFGQLVSFSVSVSASGGSGVPTGTVTLDDTGTALGSVTLDAAGAASFSGIPLSAGSHFLTAHYSGDQNFNSGLSAAIRQVVSKADSSSTLTSNPNPSAFGATIQLTAIVTAIAPGGGTPTGVVIFADGTAPIGSGILVNGRAVLSLSSLAAGSHNITASYGGDSNFNPAAASAANSVTQNVDKSSSSIILSGLPNPSTFGQAVTLTARVPGSAGGSPTGIVSFMDGTAPLGSSPLAAGSAAITISSLQIGSHNLVASYPGDANFLSSSSSVLVQVVNKAAEKDFTLNVRDSAPMIRAGQSFTTLVTLTPLNGLTGSVRTICSGAPIGASCSITPAGSTFRGNLPVTAQLTLNTTGPASDSSGSSGPEHGTYKRPPHRALQSSLATFPLFGLCVLPFVKRRGRGLAAIALLGASLTGCGSDLGAMGKPQTPKGVYAITVQAQSGQITHSQTIQLTVR